MKPSRITDTTLYLQFPIKNNKPVMEIFVVLTSPGPCLDLEGTKKPFQMKNFINTKGISSEFKLIKFGSSRDNLASAILMAILKP